MEKIGIIGLGWLGLELAKSFKNENKYVWGTTTSASKLDEVSKYGIDAIQFEIHESGYEGEISDYLNQTTHLFINIPPGLRKNQSSNFVKKLSLLLDLISNSSIKHLTYISSTSVFEDQLEIPVYTESSRPNGTSRTAQQLITAEDLVLQQKSPTVQVLRFGGLIGGERHPAKFLAGRKELQNPQAPVNLIRREDAVALSKKLLLNGPSGIFHGVYPNYPTRRVFYSNACKRMNLEIPCFNDLANNFGKKISSLKTSNKLNFSFKYQP